MQNHAVSERHNNEISMMCANNRVQYGLKVVIVSLHIILSRYHHYTQCMSCYVLNETYSYKMTKSPGMYIFVLFRNAVSFKQ